MVYCMAHVTDQLNIFNLFRDGIGIILCGMRFEFFPLIFTFIYELDIYKNGRK